MSVYNALWTAMYNKLTSSTALTGLLSGTAAVYNTIAPDGAVLPYIVFQNYGGGPDNTTPNDARTQPMLVKAYAASMATAGSIDAQAHALLTGGISVGGYTNFWYSRDLDVTGEETDPAGQKVYMAGAVYRFRLSK